MTNFETIKFTDGDLSLDVRVSVEDNTIWLSANEIAALFNVAATTIRRAIKSTYNVDATTKSAINAKNAPIASMVINLPKKKPLTVYSLDVIKTIGLRINKDITKKFESFVLESLNIKDNNNIIIYNNGSINLDVSVDPKEDTVWLTQNQIASLFESSRPNITMHINNIFSEGELMPDSVSKDFLHTALDGKQYLVQQYNLDMILAIGYRIKGKRAIEFRKWVSNVLKEYMIKGYSINESRALVTADNFLRLENEIYSLKNKIENIVKDNSYIKEKIVFKGEVFDAYELISSIVSKANNKIIIIDPYFDYQSLIFLKKVSPIVDRIIYKSRFSTLSIKEINKFIVQYGKITVINNNDFHDRFIILDDKECYSIGSSLNYAGNKTFGIIKIETKELVEAILSSLN
ncbi:MAG: virulence RhuM family protein [Bacilli bacterium]|nr:virulence RhuM family protein [Bacilli bacterium]